MDRNANRVPTTTVDSPIAASVRPASDGRWLAEVHLSDGARLTKWFDSEDDAARYPEDLQRWVVQRMDR